MILKPFGKICDSCGGLIDLLTVNESVNERERFKFEHPPPLVLVLIIKYQGKTSLTPLQKVISCISIPTTAAKDFYIAKQAIKHLNETNGDETAKPKAWVRIKLPLFPTYFDLIHDKL